VTDIDRSIETESKPSVEVQIVDSLQKINPLILGQEMMYEEARKNAAINPREYRTSHETGIRAEYLQRRPEKKQN